MDSILAAATTFARMVMPMFVPMLAAMAPAAATAFMIFSVTITSAAFVIVAMDTSTTAFMCFALAMLMAVPAASDYRGRGLQFTTLKLGNGFCNRLRVGPHDLNAMVVKAQQAAAVDAAADHGVDRPMLLVRRGVVAEQYFHMCFAFRIEDLVGDCIGKVWLKPGLQALGLGGWNTKSHVASSGSRCSAGSAGR